MQGSAAGLPAVHQVAELVCVKGSLQTKLAITVVLAFEAIFTARRSHSTYSVLPVRHLVNSKGVPETYSTQGFIGSEAN